MGLSCGVVCVILRLAVLIQYWSVTDTHTQTDRHMTKAYTALSIASRGKNVAPIHHCELPHANSPDVAGGTVARRLRIDVHDNADDDNDNA